MPYRPPVLCKRQHASYTILRSLVLIVTISCYTGGGLRAATLFKQVGISSSPNPVGSGARAVGMGGAFIAIADDATAASWNPAGLIQLEKPELSIVGAYSGRREDFLSALHPETNSTGSGDDLNVNYVSAAYPFHLYRNMVISLNHQRLFEFDRSFHHDLDFSPAGLDYVQRRRYDQQGAIGALGVAMAVEITPRFSVGATLNIWTGQLGWHNGWEGTFTEHGVGTIGGVPMIIDTRIRDKYSDFHGVNSNVGLLWDANQHLTIGAVAKTPFTASLRHEFSLSQVQSLGSPLDTTDTDHLSMDEDVSLQLPLSYGIGFAWRFSDALTVDSDIYRTDWSSYILTDADDNSFSPIDGQPASDSDVEDTVQIRVGGEYLFIRGHTATVIPVRVGVFYDPEPSHGELRDYFGIAIGAGIAHDRFVLDAAYQLRWASGVDTGNLIAGSEADVVQHTFLASIVVHL